MNKFKVGDKVRVRKDLIVDNYYKSENGESNSFVEGMEFTRGKEYKIMDTNSTTYGLNLERDADIYGFTDEMLEKVEFTYKDIKEGDIITFDDGEVETVVKSEYSAFELETDNYAIIENIMGYIVKVERPRGTDVVYTAPEKPKKPKLTRSANILWLGDDNNLYMWDYTKLDYVKLMKEEK